MNIFFYNTFRFLLVINLYFCSNTILCDSIPELSFKSSSDFPKNLLEEIASKLKLKIIKIESLNGLVNENYLLTFEDQTSLVVKIFNLKIGGYELRKNEIENQILAWKYNIAPKADFLNEKVALIEFLPSEVEFVINRENVLQCAHLMGNLHSSNLPFKGEFDFAIWAKEYLNICVKEKTISPDEEVFIKEMIERFKILSQNIPVKVPCHNDLRISNIIVGQKEISFIDWEDSSINDPAWEISYFFIASFVPKDLWFPFFREYKPYMLIDDPTLMKRVKLYRPFVLVKIALSLKAYLSKEEQELEGFSKLITLCMDTSKQIFEDKNYQDFLISFENKKITLTNGEIDDN